jgi:hypothetical protein
MNKLFLLSFFFILGLFFPPLFFILPILFYFLLIFFFRRLFPLIAAKAIHFPDFSGARSPPLF